MGNQDGGCNRLIGGIELDADRLRFGTVGSTMMACPPELMERERRFITALERVRRWSIDRRSLLLQDGKGRTLLLFQAQD